MDESVKAQIQAEYEKLESFRNGELTALAEKYNLTLDELLNVINL